MVKDMRRNLLIAGLTAGLITSAPAIGQEAAIVAETQADEAQTDEAFDEALNQFGYGAGIALQCSKGDEEKQVLAQVQQVFNKLGQLFGTDRAFNFAAAFGAGSVDKIEEGSCDAYKRGFYDALKARNLADGDSR